MSYMNISDAAAAAGVTPKMIRHYESLGLLPQVQRTEAGYRLYGAPEIEMLRFIRQSRALGFSMEQTQSLLSLWQDEGRESRDVKALAQRQLADLRERQRELAEMAAALTRLVDGCAGDHRSHCPILQDIAASKAIEVQPVAKAAARTLKQVRPGSAGAKTGAPRRAARPDPEPPPHSGLMAWSRGFRASPMHA